MARPARPANRETFAERRDRRANIDDPQVVLNVAAHFLEVRSRSVEEVRRHLIRAGYKNDLVLGAVGRLAELGMLNDDAFARAWLESRFRSRPRSSRVLRQELAQKGIDRAIVEAAMAEREEMRSDALAGPASQRSDVESTDARTTADEDAAERLLAKRGPALRRVIDPRVRRQRAYMLLARNGFDPDVCREAANRFVARGAEEDGDFAREEE
jgi:SOS response regulatory protein OraA/RecX